MNPVSGAFLLDPILPVPVILALGLVLAGLLTWPYLRTDAVLGRGRNVLLLSLRLVGVLLLMLLLLQPSRSEPLPPPQADRVLLFGLDTSRSMKQQDVPKGTRLNAVKSLLTDSGIINTRGLPTDDRLRFFEFQEEATPVTGSVLDLVPKGHSTRLHHPIQTMINSVNPGGARALVLLSDGHDFELVNPARTAMAAKARQVPIYAVAFGKQGKVRDVAVHITSFQPYSYVKQAARITASLRLIGCEFEDLHVQLLRQGLVVQSKQVNAQELGEIPVEFQVTEPVTGQYEYEVRVQPLPGEVELSNNSALTYLNVIDQQIQVLVLEGQPYWDTTFLQRSLMGNDKFSVDSLVQYANRKVRPIRKHEGTGDLHVPATLEQFKKYDVIVLGKSVDQLLHRPQLDLLQKYVSDYGGTVIFSRGRAFEGELASNDLEPVIWGDPVKDKVHIEVTTEGRAIGALRQMSDADSGNGLPELLAGRSVKETKPLTSTLARLDQRDDSALSAAIVHRRLGKGQVISVGVEGLWRWSLNSKSDGPNTAFDRFWDQMLLWLMAGRDFVPAKQFSFRTSNANVQLGEKIYFRLLMRTPDPNVKSVPLRILQDDREVARTVMMASASEGADRLTAEFTPEQMGRYRVVASFPDGTQQESKFIVYSENLEDTEVATDTGTLKRLCEASGGRLLAPEELGRLVQELQKEKVDQLPQIRLASIWDRAWVFYGIGLLFGAEWFLRRRWGLS